LEPFRHLDAELLLQQTISVPISTLLDEVCRQRPRVAAEPLRRRLRARSDEAAATLDTGPPSPVPGAMSERQPGDLLGERRLRADGFAAAEPADL
jgi:hypothetical protein